MPHQTLPDEKQEKSSNSEKGAIDKIFSAPSDVKSEESSPSQESGKNPAQDPENQDTGSETGAEASGSETPDETSKPGPVPYERFSKVNGGFKAAKEENESLKGELENLKNELKTLQDNPAQSDGGTEEEATSGIDEDTYYSDPHGTVNEEIKRLRDELKEANEKADRAEQAAQNAGQDIKKMTHAQNIGRFEGYDQVVHDSGFAETASMNQEFVKAVEESDDPYGLMYETASAWREKYGEKIKGVSESMNSKKKPKAEEPQSQAKNEPETDDSYDDGPDVDGSGNPFISISDLPSTSNNRRKSETGDEKKPRGAVDSIWS